MNSPSPGPRQQGRRWDCRGKGQSWHQELQHPSLGKQRTGVGGAPPLPVFLQLAQNEQIPEAWAQHGNSGRAARGDVLQEREPTQGEREQRLPPEQLREASLAPRLAAVPPGTAGERARLPPAWP